MRGIMIWRCTTRTTGTCAGGERQLDAQWARSAGGLPGGGSPRPREVLGVETCPSCGYSRRGLPEGHRCPECGLARDGGTVVFDVTRRRSRAWLVAGALLTAWVAVALLCGLARNDPLIIGVYGAATLLAGSAWIIWLRSLGRRCVVVTSSEVACHQRGRRTWAVSLRRVWRAEVSNLSREIALFDREGRRIATLPPFAGVDQKVAEALCGAINERVEGRGAPDGPARQA